MARLASEEKAGFYPTPPSQVELVACRLRAEPGSALNILDPCCGEGDALAEMAAALRRQGAQVRSYGVELEKFRAAKSRGKLDHVICSPYEDARVTPLAFSFLWLNPPYTQRGRERAEVAFLRDLTDWSGGKLQPGGLLGYCIRREVLEDAAALLALRFDGIRAYRFTDPDYAAFHQVVIFGYRRAEKCPDPYPLRDLLRRMAYVELPPLDLEDGVVFDVPPAAREVATFQANVFTPEEVAAAVKASPLWEEIKRFEVRPRAVLKPPVLPLKPTHIAVAIAAGAVGGNMGDHILVGSTTRVVSEDTVEDEKGMKKIERYESRSVIRLFNRNGIYVLT